MEGCCTDTDSFDVEDGVLRSCRQFAGGVAEVTNPHLQAMIGSQGIGMYKLEWNSV